MRIKWDKSNLMNNIQEATSRPEPFEKALESVKEFNKDLCKKLDESCIKFLKENGYKPKLTQKYFKSLKKRLEKKGLSLIPIYKTNDNYITVEVSWMFYKIGDNL